MENLLDEPLTTEEQTEEWEARYDDIIAEKADMVRTYERKINRDEPLYLITWSPDPKETPDASIMIQHYHWYPFLVKAMLCWEVSLMCLETSQRAGIHYHGWYQCSEDPIKEIGRCAYMKVLERFGQLKITKSIGCYVRNSYSKHANCLHYYKADMAQRGILYKQTPFCVETEQTQYEKDIFWPSYWMTNGKKQTVSELTKVSNRDKLLEFYAENLHYI